LNDADQAGHQVVREYVDFLFLQAGFDGFAHYLRRGLSPGAGEAGNPLAGCFIEPDCDGGWHGFIVA